MAALIFYVRVFYRANRNQEKNIFPMLLTNLPLVPSKF